MWYYAPKTKRYVPEGYLDSIDEVYGEGTSKVLIRDKKWFVQRTRLSLIFTSPPSPKCMP